MECGRCKPSNLAELYILGRPPFATRETVAFIEGCRRTLRVVAASVSTPDLWPSFGTIWALSQMPLVPLSRWRFVRLSCFCGSPLCDRSRHGCDALVKDVRGSLAALASVPVERGIAASLCVLVIEHATACYGIARVGLLRLRLAHLSVGHYKRA
eukprot:Polyplicarium_translucidae@DN2319_c0_g1_i3.p1